MGVTESHEREIDNPPHLSLYVKLWKNTMNTIKTYT